MNDIIERLAKVIVSSQPSYSRLDMDGAYPMANQVFSVMADENERLREALQPFVCQCADGWCTEYIKPINEAKAGCEHYKARVALGEKE